MEGYLLKAVGDRERESRPGVLNMLFAGTDGPIASDDTNLGMTVQ